MKIRELPTIYNVDKVRLYQGNRIIGETWVGSTVMLYIEEKFPTYLDSVIDYLEMCIEGCISEVLVLEIYIK